MGAGEPKLKDENYSNFGGLNLKLSQYITQKNQFLTLRNLDAQVQGSLTKTWGSSAYASGNGITQPVWGLGEFFALGASFTGTSYIQGYTNIDVAAGNVAAFQMHETGFTNIYNYLWPQSIAGLKEDFPTDFLSLAYLYGANSFEFYTARLTPGFTIMPYSLPATGPYVDSISVGATGPSFVLNSVYDFNFAFIRSDGFIGPSITRSVTFLQAGPNGSQSFIIRVPSMPDIAIPDGVGGLSSLITATPQFFGISGIVAWVSTGTTYQNYTNILPPGATVGVDASLNSWLGNYQVDEEPFLGNYLYQFNSAPTQTNINLLLYPQMQPSCIEVFANQLFMSGFLRNTQYSQDTVVYSRIGEYEKIDPESFFEVRANDGDIVTCMKAYFTELVIFKSKTTHSLRGDNPDNFVLSEATPIYGCLSNNSACIWEQRLWFLDERGIAEYNGANTKIISDAVQPIFQSMNVEQARYVATMIYVKERYEVWCFIPTGTNDYCDTVVIYDHLANEWYTRDNMTRNKSAAMIKGFYKDPKPFIGGASGIVESIDSIYPSMNGRGMTCVAKSRYIDTQMGHSVQKVFRQLFLDCDVEGASIPIDINFYANQSTVAIFQATMILNQFQNRIDFGISAKDLSVEFVYSSESPLRINGFTIAYRFQRAV